MTKINLKTQKEAMALSHALAQVSTTYVGRDEYGDYTKIETAATRETIAKLAKKLHIKGF